MARKEEIEFFISEDGQIQFHIKGVKGNKCVDVAKALAGEQGKVKDLKFSSEYYEKVDPASKIKQSL
jgi:hypothetical protein